MAKEIFVINVEVSCEENLGKLYAGMTLPMALVRPSNELVLCEAHFPAVEGLNRRDAIVEKLSPYFGARFRRDRLTGTDRLEQLADDLMTYNHKLKDYARIALMLFDSGVMICKPKTFSEWYKLFCQAVGCRYVRSYHPHNIGSYDKVKRVFYYVE